MAGVCSSVGAHAISTNGEFDLPVAAFFLISDLAPAGWPNDALGDAALFCVALSLPALFVAPIAACWPARMVIVLLPQSFARCLRVVEGRFLKRL